MIHQSPTLPRLDADPATLVIRSIISTSQPDRAGDVIVPAGLQNQDEFLKNPVVLWAHQRALPPIGICKRLDVQPDRIVAETQFARGVPFAEDLFRLYAQGILRAWSIGLIPRRSVPTRRGLRIDRWDLLEYSAVPIPENPGALTLAVQKGLVRDPEFQRLLIPAVDLFSKLVA